MSRIQSDLTSRPTRELATAAFKETFIEDPEPEKVIAILESANDYPGGPEDDTEIEGVAKPEE